MELQKQQNYKVYIKTNDNNHLTAIDADWNISDKTDWLCIDEGNTPPDKYHHAQGNYLDKPLMDMQGCYNYKYIDGEILETIDAEKQAELESRPKPEPTPQEDLMSMAVDTEYRVTLLELGVR